MYIWAYNVVILFVLRSRFKIERLEDNGKIFFFLSFEIILLSLLSPILHYMPIVVAARNLAFL